jgi:hypothetical protein
MGMPDGAHRVRNVSQNAIDRVLSTKNRPSAANSPEQLTPKMPEAEPSSGDDSRLAEHAQFGRRDVRVAAGVDGATTMQRAKRLALGPNGLEPARTTAATPA